MPHILTCFVLFLAPVTAQDLIYSLAHDIPGLAHDLKKHELHRLRPGGGTAPFVPLEAWRVLLGDRNGNGIYDDEPSNINALHIRSTGGGLASWLMSTSVTIPLAGGTCLKDGDVFAFDGHGGVDVVYSENFFEVVTQTTAIDIDAFAEGPGGALWFSFADDEFTASPALTAQNGGAPSIDEQTVFRLDPAATEAVIAFTKTQVVQIFNQAAGTGAASVVDVCGLASDPANPGHLLLSSRSVSSSFQGRVVTTAGGGSTWLVGGQPVGPALFGLSAAPTLDALSLSVESPHPVLRVDPAGGSSAAGGLGHCEVRDLVPGEVVQLVVSNPRLPGPFAWQTPNVLGFVTVFPDPMDPSTWASFNVPQWHMVANANGVADYTWNWNGLAPGMAFLGQGFRISTGEATSPGIVTVAP